MKDFLAVIENAAKENKAENEAFLRQLAQMKGVNMDSEIHALAREISESVDCTTCANCCKKLEAGMTKEEAQQIADAKHQTLETLFHSDPSTGEHCLKEKPCLMLKGNLCQIYDSRPQACADFPNLYKPNIRLRAKAILANYGVCPIVFLVVEAWKRRIRMI